MKTSISWAITAHNEHIELERLLDQIVSIIRPNDEIMVQLDSTATPEVKKVAEKYNVGQEFEYHKIFTSLKGDFSAFKNNLMSHCTRDWVFFIDADEYLNNNLLENIHEILDTNQGLVDVISIPRINTVDHIGLSHIMKWKWYPSKIEKPEFIKEKILDLDNSQDRDHYELLKSGGFIIEEYIESKPGC
jgi:glycosyltransferase involved in cell wall biosynthesis